MMRFIEDALCAVLIALYVALAVCAVILGVCLLHIHPFGAA